MTLPNEFTPEPMPSNTEASAAEHLPVMLREVVDCLAPQDGGIYVDGTFGRGGYSLAILAAANCAVIAIDRDPGAIAAGKPLVAQHAGRLELIEGRFGAMDRLIAVRPIDGIALDLGVSSPQIDRPERGFSFRHDGPLDMRMGGDGPTAADVVNNLPEAELADLIWRLGEERRSRHVADAIVAARRTAPIDTTLRLAEIVRSVVRQARDGIDPATRTFQALRLYVNDELGELKRGLGAAERLLAPGGRLVVVSFHSLEDRIVKDFLRQRTGTAPKGSRHLPASPSQGSAPTFELLERGARRPSAAECARNPRARSARLRTARRTAAPAQQEGRA